MILKNGRIQIQYRISMDIIRSKKTIPRHSDIRPQHLWSEFAQARGTGEKKLQSSPSIPKRNTKARSPLNRKKRHWGQFFIISLALFTLCFTVWSGYFFWKALQTTQQMNGKNSSISSLLKTAATILPTPQKSRNNTPLRGQDTGRINILLLGKATTGYAGEELTDSIIVASIDTVSSKVALLSIPRDLYVSVPESNTFTKINALYRMGLEGKNTSRAYEEGLALSRDSDPTRYIRQSVEEITGLAIHYYLCVDYSAFASVVNALGGINVRVERDILDTRYPGPNYSYQTFRLDKGFHTLDGDTALKYVRERHSDPEGDFGRAKRQQQVMQAIKNKSFSLGTFFNPFTLTSILETLGENIRTDITIGEIESFLSLAKKVDTQNVTNIVLDAWKKESLLRVSHVLSRSGKAFVLIPRAGNYSEIQELAQNVFHYTERESRLISIRNENPTVVIINAGAKATVTKQISKLLSNLGMNTTLITNHSTYYASSNKVIDLTNLRKPYALDEIIKRLPAEKISLAQTDIRLSEAQLEKNDFALIIGSNTSTHYDWEEATEEDIRRYNADEIPINE